MNYKKPGDASLRKEVVDLIIRYNWLTLEDGKRMLGWLACALVSNSLEHRPHVWLSGFPGKSWFIKHIQDPLHQYSYDFYYSPSKYNARSGIFPPQVIDMCDYLDTQNQVIKSKYREVKRVIQACRAASGFIDYCGNYGPLRFCACIMSHKQPELTRYETRQFAPVRLGPEMSHREFSRYETEIDSIFGSDSNGVPMILKESILNSADEIAEHAIQLDKRAQHENMNHPRQVEIDSIIGSLSAGWQWWSGTDELLRYWTGERPIKGDPE